MTHTRQKERAEIAEMLEAGQSIIMLAPRRIGKTWLLKEVSKDLKKKGLNAVCIDVAGTTTSLQAVQELCKEIERSTDLKTRMFAHLKQRAQQSISGSGNQSLVDAIANVNPNDFLETLIEGLNKEKTRTVIFIDELALFVLEYANRERDAAHSFVYRLRHLREKYSNVCWFFTGSVGLDVVAERHLLRGALVDLEIFPLEPFTHAEARSYCSSLDAQPVPSRRFAFDEGAFEYLAQQLGWLSPYYLRHILSKVRPTGGADEVTKLLKANVDDIEAGIIKLLAHDFKIHFTTWGEHLDKNFKPSEAATLRAILDVLSSADSGEEEATLMVSAVNRGYGMTLRQLKDHLSVLLSAGFIEQKADRWQFRSGLLRRYWLRHEV